jgi:hypothetical protein
MEGDHTPTVPSENLPRMAGSDQSPQTFAFVVFNQKNRNATPTKAMRAHAMRNAIRRKRLETRNIALGEPAPYQTARFRLSSPPTKRKGTKSLEGSTSSGESVLDVSKKPVEKAYDLAQRIHHDQHRLSTVPSRGRVDPFNTFPITLGPRQHMLLSYCKCYSSHIYHLSLSCLLSEVAKKNLFGIDKTSFTQNSLAFYSGQKPRLFAPSSDPAWLHATLAIVAVHYTFACGVLNGASLESLFHRGEAIRLVRDRLSDPFGGVSDNTIGAIASLANHEVSEKSFFLLVEHVV